MAHWFPVHTLLRQSPKGEQCSLKTSSFPDANWLSVASAGTLCACKNLRLDPGHNHSTRSPACSSFFSWQHGASGAPTTKPRPQLTLCLSVSHPAVPLPALPSGSAAGPAGSCALALGRTLGCSWRPDASSAYKAVMFMLWSLWKSFLSVRKDCYFPFPCMEEFFKECSLHGPAKLLSRNLFTLFGG